MASDNGTTNSLPVRGNQITNLVDTLIELACAGLGIIRIAEFCAADDLRSERLVQVLGACRADEDQPIIACHRSRRNLSPRIRVFVDFLHERFAFGPWRTALSRSARSCRHRPRSRSR